MWLENVMEDTRQALRRLCLAPAFTIATILLWRNKRIRTRKLC
jgi:hypothetical protein